MEDIVNRAARLGLETEYRNAFGERRAVPADVLARLIDALSPAGGAAGARVRTVVDRGDCAGDASGDAARTVAPEQAYQGDEAAPARMWAVAVQLYAVRSRRNWGHGDFSDLAGLVDVAADLGAAGLALNPLHALFDERPELASPYSPNSRLFLNPLYIDVEALPEFPGLRAAGLESEIEQLRKSRMIDYGRVARAKRHALELAHALFRRHGNAQRRRAFERFRRERGAALARFACFELLRRRLSGPWWQWPAQWRTADEQALDRLRRREERAVEFFEFVQWAAHQQLALCRARCSERGLPIGLYLDVAVGVRGDGFDAWGDQDVIVSGVAIGAPPDALNTAGQNWGLAASNPLALEAAQFEPFARMLKASMQYAGAVRLDHVLGLQRLYLIPDGVPASDGAYIRFPFAALLAVTALTSVEEKCIVIGEDLGTVPDKFRAALASWGIWSYHVMLFERTAEGAFCAPESYREQALATFATHDMPTFAGWRDQRDLAIKHALGIDPGESAEQRGRALDALAQALRQRGMEAMAFASVARYLADAPSRLLVVSIEDLLDVDDQINLPGTIDQYPNWRHRLPVDLEDLRNQPGPRSVSEIMRSAGRSSAR